MRRRGGNQHQSQTACARLSLTRSEAYPKKVESPAMALMTLKSVPPVRVESLADFESLVVGNGCIQLLLERGPGFGFRTSGERTSGGMSSAAAIVELAAALSF